MQRDRSRGCGAIGKALVVLALGMATTAPASALQLRYKFKRGAVATYRVMVAAGALAQTPVTPAPMKMQFAVDMRSVQKVVAVSRAGVADLEHVTTSGTMKMTSMGKTNSSRVPHDVTHIKLTDRGKLLAYHTQSTGGQPAEAAADGPPGLDQADPLRALSGLNFPERDLKPGDTWATESKVDVGGGRSVAMKIASRLVTLTRYKGRNCAKIETTFEMPMDTAGMNGESKGVAMKGDGKIAGQLTTLFDYDAGQEVYADGSVIMLVKVQMSGAMDATGAGQSVDMNSAMKMNVRQVLID